MIRYYKGVQMVVKLTSMSKMKTALYETLEVGELGEIGIRHIIPVRLCHRNKKR